MMYRFLWIGFLCVSFFTVSVKAQQTAHAIFVDFVIEHLGSSGQVEEFEQIMGPDWLDEITLYTESWHSADAEYFLNTLKASDVKPEHILKILQAGSFLQALHAGQLKLQFVEGEVQSLAYDVFLDFVIEQLEASEQIEEFEQIMGPDWIDEITLYTESWHSIDAKYFLNIMKETGVETEHILKILQAGSFLQALQSGHLHFEFPSRTEIVDITQFAEVEIPEQLIEFTFLNEALGNETNGHRILIQFVNVAREQLGIAEFDRIMGHSWDQSVWEERLIKYMDKANWTELDARNFIVFLVGRIGLESTLKRIKNNTSYLGEMNYLDFRTKVLFYDELLGEETVTTLLNKSLGGFRKKNHLPELQAIISFIHKYIEDEEELKKFVEQKIIDIAIVTYNNLMGFEEFLLAYHFTKDEIKILMQESFQGFTRTKPESLWAVADFLINGKVKTNDQSQVVFDWEGNNFTKTEVKTLIQKSFFSFTNAKSANLRAIVEFLINEYHFTKLEVKILIQKSFEGFTRFNPDNLQIVADFLINGKIKINGQDQVVFDWEDNNFTKAEVKKLMQENFTGFTRANPENLRAVADFLINGKNKNQ